MAEVRYLPLAHSNLMCERCGSPIYKGDPYITYRVKSSSVRCSSCPPRRSDLTANPVMALIYDAEDAVNDGDLDGALSLVFEAQLTIIRHLNRRNNKRMRRQYKALDDWAFKLELGEESYYEGPGGPPGRPRKNRAKSPP